MATLTITNISSELQPLNEFYKTLAVSEAITVTRPVNDVSGMSGIQKLVADGKITVAVALSADEIASGLAQDSKTVEARDIAPVDATAAFGGLITLYVAFAAGAGGSADDVTLVAPGALPQKLRILDAIAYVTTAVGSSSAQVRNATAGGGTSYATLDTGTTGRKANTGTTAANTVAASAGLYLRRTDSGAAGQVILICRPEN